MAHVLVVNNPVCSRCGLSRHSCGCGRHTGLRWQPLTNAKGENCGTGAGGFKRGNTCAVGGMIRGWEDSEAGLAKALTLPGAEYSSHWKETTAILNRNALEQQARVIKAARKLGFTENPTESEVNWLVYEHPEGHTLILSRSYPPGRTNVRILAVVRWVAPEHREGYAVSREALRASLATPKPEINAVYAAREAKYGTDLTLTYHQGAATYHEELARNTMDREHARLHRDAAAAHRIALDYHNERLGRV